jgi:hypothetical protein
VPRLLFVFFGGWFRSDDRADGALTLEDSGHKWYPERLFSLNFEPGSVGGVFCGNSTGGQAGELKSVGLPLVAGFRSRYSR